MPGRFAKSLYAGCITAALAAALMGGALPAQGPRHILWTDISGMPQAQRHDWVQQTGGRWVETLADGQVTRFTVVEAASELHGVKGETVIDPGHMKVFVPDVSDTGPYAKVLYYIDLSGDSQEWQVLGIFQEQP